MDTSESVRVIMFDMKKLVLVFSLFFVVSAFAQYDEPRSDGLSGVDEDEYREQMRKRKRLEESLPGMESNFQRTQVDLIRCQENYTAEELEAGACKPQSDAAAQSRHEVRDLCKRIHKQGGPAQPCWQNHGL